MTDDAWLQDILEFADELAGFVAGVDAQGFVVDRKLQRAVERLLTLIGEAAKQLRPETRAAINQPWAEIIRFRDRAVHAYDSLAPATVLAIAQRGVPGLRRAVAAHLAQRKASGRAA